MRRSSKRRDYQKPFIISWPLVFGICFPLVSLAFWWDFISKNNMFWIVNEIPKARKNYYFGFSSFLHSLSILWQWFNWVWKGYLKYQNNMKLINPWSCGNNYGSCLPTTAYHWGFICLLGKTKLTTSNFLFFLFPLVRLLGRELPSAWFFFHLLFYFHPNHWFTVCDR